MTTFIIGVIILAVGGFLYGKFVEKVFGPDDRKTPAVEFEDGVDFVPMKKWRNWLIELLNIAGTGPVLGPIQGILFGPIALITIPIGCVIGGATHDYFNGMISMRNGGAQMPGLIGKYLGIKMTGFYTIVMWILMLLTGVVFVYTPGDLIVGDILGRIGGILAIIGVIVLPITSGDTAFRSVRLMIAEKFNIDQKNKWNRIKITVLIFIPAIAILIFAKSNSGGFNLLWRYFGFTNQFVATFALAMASVYLIVHSKANSMRFLLTAIPGLFYVFIVISYIFHAPIGIGIEKRLSGIVGISPDSYAVSYVIGIVAALLYAAYIIHLGKEKSKTM